MTSPEGTNADTAGTGSPHANPTEPFGAEITGIDLTAALSATVARQLRDLLAQHQVLFWREPDITVDQQLAFAEALGPPLEFTSVVDTAAGTSSIHEVRGSTVGWHIDASSMLTPPVATLLRAVEIPTDGGDTIWASGVAAHAALPDKLRSRIEGRYVTHGKTPQGEGADPLVAHPLVRNHPDTGRPCLYINFAPWADAQILGLTKKDSDDLVAALREIYLDPKRQLRFRWNLGAVALWDNRAV